MRSSTSTVLILLTLSSGAFGQFPRRTQQMSVPSNQNDSRNIETEVGNFNTPADAWTRQVNVELVAPPSKGSNAPWDMDLLRAPFLCVPGTPFCTGSSPLGGSEAPDMLLIILDSEGNKVLYGLRPGERKSRASASLVNMITNPADATSLARCPNAYVCQYQGIRLPETTFGVLVLDQDLRENDFMLAGIVFSANSTDQQVDRVEKHLHEFIGQLRQFGLIAGGPEPNTELPLARLESCKADVSDKPCFNDTLGGIAGIRFLRSGSDMTGLPCVSGTIEGEATARTKVALQVEVEFKPVNSACDGRLEYRWDFEGAIETTSETSVVHIYNRPGTYVVRVTPRCVKRTRACDGVTLPLRVTAAN